MAYFGTGAFLVGVGITGHVPQAGHLTGLAVGGASWIGLGLAIVANGLAYLLRSETLFSATIIAGGLSIGCVNLGFVLDQRPLYAAVGFILALAMIVIGVARLAGVMMRLLRWLRRLADEPPESAATAERPPAAQPAFAPQPTTSTLPDAEPNLRRARRGHPSEPRRGLPTPDRLEGPRRHQHAE